MNVEAKPKRGCERFLNIDVFATGQVITFDARTMDRKGHKEAQVAELYIAFEGNVTARWIDSGKRGECKLDQERRNRWENIVVNTARLKKGQLPPPPVFLDPSITGTGLYRNIDGARKIMSMAEANHIELRCIILKKDFQPASRLYWPEDGRKTINGDVGSQEE